MLKLSLVVFYCGVGWGASSPNSVYMPEAPDTLFTLLPFAAASLAFALALFSLVPKKRSVSTWCFFAGMTILGTDTLSTGLSVRAAEGLEVLGGSTLGLMANSFAPAAWLAFSFVYSRGDYRERLSRWKYPFVCLALAPIVFSFAFRQELLMWEPEGARMHLRFDDTAKFLNAILLVAYVWILTNLEHTFRSAIGTTRWRIKFVVLGLTVIFGARIYVRSQALLFSTYDPQWSGIEASALFIGCILLVVAYMRNGFAELDVYPSRAALGSSLTVLMAGGYLFVVGVVARIVRSFGGAEYFQLQALIVLLGFGGLAVLLLSDRLRQRLHAFLGRHFQRAQYDSVRIWTEFSRRLGNVKDQAGLCAASATMISEVFEVLSVTIWLLDEQREEFISGASTSPQQSEGTPRKIPGAVSRAVSTGLRGRSSPFDLDRVDEPWAEELRQMNPTTFPNGGNRWCVPLRAREKNAGFLVLADRVNGAHYTAEELHVLQCIADQVTSVLLNLRLAHEVARAREMEAFRTMSAFFVHDLKNSAAALNLMLNNARSHFDDPAFRDDALRGIGNTARRIEDLVGRLTALRQRPEFKPVEADLNELVSEVLETIDRMPQVDLTKELRPLPRILADREQIQTAVANLVLNARDALGPGGHIRVRTEHDGGSVVLTVADDGCGISEAFLRNSLFRPFQSTKKKGLGIGMFQSRTIVEAHGGTIRVESEAGKGSTFWVTLPIKSAE